MAEFFENTLAFFKTILSFIETTINSIGMLFKMIPIVGGFVASSLSYMPVFIGAFLLLSFSVLVIKLLIEAF